MKLGIFGGSFNPIHNAHIKLCEYVIEKTVVDKILLVPTGDNPLKNTDDMIKREHRFNMTLAAVDGRKDIYVSDLEINREGVSYTVDTLERINELYSADKYFIFGSDILFQLSKWKSFDKLCRMVGFVCVMRKSTDFGACLNVAQRLSADFGANIILLDENVTDNISSSMVRSLVRQGGDISSFVPARVAEYIKINDLYK